MLNIFKAMFGANSQPSHDLLPDGILDSLMEREEATFVINIRSLSLIAANNSGQTLFTQPYDQKPQFLDAAMPAARRIKAMAHNINLPSRLDNLVFWTATGVKKLNCSVEHVGESIDPSLIILKVEVEPTEQFVSKDQLSSERFQPTSAPQSNKEILDQIARLIQEGSKNTDNKNSFSHQDIEKLNTEKNIETPSPRREQSSIQKHLNPVLKNLKFERIELNSELKECHSIIKKITNAEDVKFKNRSCNKNFSVTADASSIKQILLNLFFSALKLTPPGGIIEVALYSNKKGDVILSITGGCHGMTPFEIAKGLETIEASGIKGKEDVSESSLPLAKALAEANGASLSIQSIHGKGTCLSLTFARRSFTVI